MYFVFHIQKNLKFIFRFIILVNVLLEFSETEFYEISKKLVKEEKNIIRPFINSKEKLLQKITKYCKKIPKLKGIIFTATKKTFRRIFRFFF